MASYFDQVNGLAPKVWYRFNETAGTPVNSGSLTTTGGFANLLLNEQTDVDGRAIYFNGNSAYIALNAWQSFELFNDKSFTIETWFKLGQIDTNDRPMYRFSGPAPISNTLGINVLSTANGNGKIQLKIAGLGNQTADANTISTNTYNDNKWHHTVVAVNTTSLKWYIDGNLETTKTLTTSTLNWDSYTSSGNLQRLIGTGRSNSSETISQNKYLGWLDEFAIYGYELTGAQVLANFNAGASVQFADIPGTASALAVMPTNSTQTILTAAPMTANATADGHFASTIDLPKLLNTYMGELSLETWFKFDINKSLTNYGSGLEAAANWFGDVKNNVTGGVQGSGSISLKGTNTDNFINTAAVVVSGVTQATPMASQCQDENFTVGFWIKKETKELTDYFWRLRGTGANPDEVTLFWNADGGITFRIYANNTNYDVASSTDITDGEWHFITARLDSNTMELFIDNSSIGTTTMNHGLTLVFSTFGGGGSTDYISLSQFFISTSANVGSTQIANIYDYGIPTSTQAAAIMPPAGVKFNSAFNDYIQSKSPLFDFRMDETAGVPRNFGSVDVTLASDTDPEGYTQNEVGLNNRAFKFTNRNQALRGSFTVNSGDLSGSDIATLGVLFKHNFKTIGHAHAGLGGATAAGVGFYIQSQTSGVLRVVYGTGGTGSSTLDGTTDFSDDKWHLAIVVADGTNIKLYVDGKLEASKTATIPFTDTNQFTISGIPNASQNSNSNLVKYIDEVFATNTAFTAQEAFEAYRALRLEMDTTASASLPMPTNIAGTGFDHAAAAFTASSLFDMPGFLTDQILDTTPLTASAEFILPNFGGNVVIDANYGHTAATASAELLEVGANIGENHIAIHFEASALFVHPISTGGGRITVSTAIGSAEFVMPGIVTIKGARVFAEPARANAFIPLPPAYLQLTDDQWYVRLFAQHAEQNIEPAFVAANLPNTPSTQIAKTVLKFFEDVTSSITVGNGYLENNLEEKIFKAPGSTDTSKVKIYPSIAPNLTPTPALYTGYFDDFGRKAVRVENIEFAFPEEIYKSKLPFSLEFSIKTTKANQIIAQGKWASFLSFQKQTTGFGLYDGKLYLMNSNTSSGVPGNRTAHPANPDMAGNPVMIGRKNIADGKWHHIIIQIGYTDNRIQFWCDGQLDRQQIGGGEQYSRLYIMGSNNGIATYQSDFETSGWSYDKQAFIEEQDVDLNYIGYLKYEPIAAEPMKATITMTDNNTAAGNRGRAIVFYFWPEETDRIIAPNPPINSIRGGSTLSGVTTDDYFRQPPQEWYGWDLFPIDVTGRYVSELVKPEAYGVNNIKIQEPSFFVTGVGRDDSAKYAHKVNIRGYFTDPITDARRYIDVFNDIDLSQFDAIFFKNYPEETAEKDAYTREDFADQYFNLRERELFDKFLESLRKGLDTGISLFVTNDQLALDLGIVDRVEDVTDVSEGEFTEEDDYVISRTDLSGKAIVARDSGTYPDLHKNNRHQVVNTLPNLTNDPGYIWTDWFYFENDDTLDFGGANRPYTRIENRPNGLQVGDKFIISDDSTSGSTFRATPIANVKAGKVITKFADTIYRNNTLVDNPYKDYATTIAVEPGTILKGKPTVGKIFVNFTERFNYRWNGRVESREYFNVDLIQDEFINAAYNDGEISLARRDALLASPDNLDRRMEAAIAANNQNLINTITNLKYWNNNGDYVLTQKTLLDDPTGSGVQQDGLGKGVRRGRVNRVNKKGSLSTQTVSSSLQWFSLSFAYEYERAQFVAASMLTRGIRWLSDKIVDDGLVNRVEAMKVSTSELPMPTITGDKPASVNAERMLAIANIIPATGYALADVSNTTLPLTANANFGQFVKNIKPDVFTASATFRDNVRTLGVAEDQIVVYINHVDPILYIREEIIK